MYTRGLRQEVTDKVRYCFFNVGRGQATLAYIEDDENLFFGVSFCSPLDNFERAEGKAIARKRLFRNCGQKKVGLRLGGKDPKVYAVERALQDCRPQWCDKKTKVEYRLNRQTRRKEAKINGKKSRAVNWLYSWLAKKP